MIFRKLRRSIAFKSISGIVFLLVLFTGMISRVGYRGFADEIFRQYTDEAFRIADAAAKDVDADLMEDFVSSRGATADYQEAWDALDKLCNATDMTFIYVIQPDQTDYGHITFVFSTVNWNSVYTPYELGYVRPTTNDEYRLRYRELYEGKADRALMILESEQFAASTHHITAMVPLKGTDHQTKAILCVQRQLDILSAIRRDYIRKIILVLILSVAVVIVGQGMLLHFVLLQPIRKISDEATRFARENVASRQKLTSVIRNEDEIGLLAGSIDRMEEQIESYVSNLTRVTAEKERISTELNVARQIQADMLPSVFPAFPGRHDFDIYAIMRPAKEVGGDFYDFFLIDDQHLCLVMADVSGKGVPAALFMVIAKTLIKTRAQMGASPSEILYYVNNQLCEGNKAELFVTVWLAIIDLSTGEGIAANAGHEHPVICRKNGSYELVVYRHSPAVATLEDLRFREHTFRLERGDKLFVYTDGVPEATDEKETLYGTERMLSSLNSSPGSTPEQLLNDVLQDVDAFEGNTTQFDDITMLSFYYFGSEDRNMSELTVEAKLDNLQQVISFVDEHLEEMGCPMKTQLQIDVAVEEAYVNVASYAYTPGTGPVTLKVEKSASEIRITFLDSGVPFNPLEKEDPDVSLPASERQIGGLGIFMVKKSMDNVQYAYLDGKNILTLTKKIL